MHDKERSDGIFIFLQNKKKTKTAFFQLLPTTFSCGALLHDQRKLQLVIAYIQRVFVRDPGTLFIAKPSKHLIALECFLTNHGLTQSQFTCVVVWRKSFNVNYFGTSDGSRWDDYGRSVKALFIFTSETSRLCSWNLPIGMREPPPRGDAPLILTR